MSMGKSSVYRGVTLFRPTGKWRAQISAGGKTLSLGDHDTERDAARAFDRAVVHKSGRQAKTNFPISDYEDEVEQLQAMTHQELVAMLRSRARKSGSQTSHFRGVSLLKQTGRWHAQINAGGRQVHLGFFGTEEEAARAYDRAAISKGCSEGGTKIITNFDVSEYAEEISVLQSVSQEDLIAALASESTRKQAMDLLAAGFAEETAAAVFGRPLQPASSHAVFGELLRKAERALPKAAATSASQQQQQVVVEESAVHDKGDASTVADEHSGPSKGEQQQQQTTTPLKAPPSKQVSRSPLPPKTPQAASSLLPPPLATALSATGTTAAAAAAIAAALVTPSQGFPGSPPIKHERPVRRSASASVLGALALSSSLEGAKRTWSYAEGAAESGTHQEVVSMTAQQQQRAGGRKRRKLARPSRAAHA